MKFQKYFASLVTLASVALCILIFRIYLTQSTHQLGQEFRTQNLSEIHSADIFSLSSRLSALSGAVNWVCITGTRGGHVFFEKKRSYCGPAPWQKEVVVKSASAKDVEVRITVRLPVTLEFACAGLVLLQLLLMVALFRSARTIERLRLQEEANRLQLEASLGKLAAQVAHDIRNPMSVLKVGLTALKNKDIESASEMITMATERIEKISADLLTTRKALNTTLKSTQSGAPATRIDQILNTIGTEIKAKIASTQLNGVAVEVRSPPMNVQMNSNDLTRVISNLASNAVECLPQTGGKISLSCAKAKDSVVIEVADNGPGLPDTVRRNPWGGISVGKADGNGMGLRFAHEQISKNRGQITFDTGTTGTRFQIWLPLL